MKFKAALFLMMPLMAASLKAAPETSSPEAKVVAVNQVPRNPLASAKAALRAPTSTKRTPAYDIGRASWYGRPFHGRITASGETYDMFRLTAAHRTLKLGTWLKVTNLRNGKSVMVRVNDRGPVPQSRIIDLSFEAATLLDLRAHGVEAVRLDLARPETVALALNANRMR